MEQKSCNLKQRVSQNSDEEVLYSFEGVLCRGRTQWTAHHNKASWGGGLFPSTRLLTAASAICIHDGRKKSPSLLEAEGSYSLEQCARKTPLSRELQAIALHLTGDQRQHCEASSAKTSIELET